MMEIDPQVEWMAKEYIDLMRGVAQLRHERDEYRAIAERMTTLANRLSKQVWENRSAVEESDAAVARLKELAGATR